MQYQYVWTEYTNISIEKDEPKVKVVYWEIVESDLDEKNFTRNGFQKVDSSSKEKNVGGQKLETKKVSKK